MRRTSSDLHWFGAAMVKHYHGDDEDLGLLMGGITQAFADVTIDEYSARVLEFFDDVDHPTLGISYAGVQLQADGRPAPLPRGE